MFLVVEECIIGRLQTGLLGHPVTMINDLGLHLYVDIITGCIIRMASLVRERIIGDTWDASSALQEILNGLTAERPLACYKFLLQIRMICRHDGRRRWIWRINRSRLGWDGRPVIFCVCVSIMMPVSSLSSHFLSLLLLPLYLVLVLCVVTQSPVFWRTPRICWPGLRLRVLCAVYLRERKPRLCAA